MNFILQKCIYYIIDNPLKRSMKKKYVYPIVLHLCAHILLCVCVFCAIQLSLMSSCIINYLSAVEICLKSFVIALPTTQFFAHICLLVYINRQQPFASLSFQHSLADNTFFISSFILSHLLLRIHFHFYYQRLVINAFEQLRKHCERPFEWKTEISFADLTTIGVCRLQSS